MANWDEICAKLPTARSGEEKAQRNELFKQFDPNGNGYLSLAEVDKGIRDVLNLPDVFDAKPAIIRAFNAACSLGSKSGQPRRGDDYIEKREFRAFLEYLACYMRIFEAFSSADTSGDRRLSRDEFINVYPKLQKWWPGVTAEQAWARANSDGGDLILFTEFAEATIKAVMERDNPEDE